MKIVESGNYFRMGDPTGPNPQPYQMTDDVTVRGGNFVLCRVVTNGFALTIEGGNVRSLYLDGVKQDTYVWQRFGPLEMAEEILEAVQKAAGEDGTTAWLWTVQWLFDNPAATYAEWQTAYATWADATGNLIYSAAMFLRLRDRFWPGEGFNAIRDAITAHDFATWEGEPTQLVEEHS